ncbi:aminotransferase class I/II-fold pyridoxal phosphate-dependent enzyme [Actinopolymorpha alba]|uniref:aminotransferase class I/II-fold pyridoxal phosphate-dependent enzyme n=1 Tax=Actinopolymorpha alba TaxID=533267 RepID=UPI000367A815|nr:aminotransferase class I/II-fold pyridoxal phosphate-dependent enzyme [Actinopolymorpha alba]
MAPRYGIEGTTSSGIAASVEAGVRSGALTPGDPLPPVRGLATELGVSPGTVAAAYRILRQRGVVSTDGRRGTRVRPKPSVVPRSHARLPVPPGARDVSAGNPDPRLLPALGPRLRTLAPEPVLYGVVGMLPELAELARERLTADGVPADALTVTSGCLDGVERVLQTYLAPGDAVAVEDPGWSNLLDLVAAMGLRVEPVPVDDDGPDPAAVMAALRRGARALLVTSRAQNPFGAIVSAERARKLRAVLRDAPDTLVIEDDHAAELSHEPLRTLAGSTTRWALVRSMSKPYGPDLRCAVLAADEETLARVEGRQWLGVRWVSTILQSLVVALWRDPRVDALVARAGRRYDERRQGLLAALDARGVRAHGGSGLNVWVPVQDETAVCARLLEAGWVVAPGRIYRIAAGPGIRITSSALADRDIDTLAGAVAYALTPDRRPYAV